MSAAHLKSDETGINLCNRTGIASSIGHLIHTNNFVVFLSYIAGYRLIVNLIWTIDV